MGGWVECTFGSMARAFKALDSDGDKVVTFAELKYACHKLNWDGCVRSLFDCLDVDGKRGVGKEAGKRSLSLKEIAFLDQWKVREELDDRMGLAGVKDWESDDPNSSPGGLA